VVIAIIAILAGLTTAAVMKVFGTGPQAKCANDIRQLQTGLENFKNKFGSYPTGRVKLCKLYSMNNVTGDQVDQNSEAFLMKMFPCIDLNIWNGTGIDWSGGTVPGFTQAVLEGHQCLVFFLGGIPTKSGTTFGCTGFSANPKNPAALGGT